MKIKYDREVDAMYIHLVEGKQECRTVRLNDDIALDFDDEEQLLGIEILDASRVLGNGKLPKLMINEKPLEWPGLQARGAAQKTTRANGKGRHASKPGRTRKAG